jgi:hypothetical protein
MNRHFDSISELEDVFYVHKTEYRVFRRFMNAKNMKLYLQGAVEALRVPRHRSFQIFYIIGSQITVRLSALRAGLN